jgi:hypothetical protein
MEGGVYLCTWKKEGGKYHGWLRANKRLAVVVNDPDDLPDALAEEICEKTGDGEAVVEFVPRLPQPEPPNWLDRDSVILLGFGDRVETNLHERSAWIIPPCAKCRWSDARNSKFLVTMARKPKSDLAADAEYFNRTFVSAELAKLLQLAIRDIELLSVRVSGAPDAQFFELIAVPVINTIGVKGATYDKYISNVCPKCGSMSISPTVDGHWDIQEYLAREDFEKLRAPVFVIGRERGRKSLGLRHSSWERLRGKPGARGITTEPVGIVSKEYVVRRPKLPLMPRS